MEGTGNGTGTESFPKPKKWKGKGKLSITRPGNGKGTLYIKFWNVDIAAFFPPSITFYSAKIGPLCRVDKGRPPDPP